MYSHNRPGRPPTRAQRGLICSPHYLASSTGLDILRDGGSAVDAAIAANATLCVVYPHMAGLGGDGFWQICADGEVSAINASGPAASEATREYYKELDYEEIPERGSASALTVPGAVDGWRLAHEKHGKLPWGRLFADAITYAREGVAITDDFARWIAKDAEVLAEQPAAADTFLSDGEAPVAGTIIRQPSLADSFETLVDHGPRKGFYEGPIATSFCEGLGEESPLAPSDFSDYSAEWVTPLTTEYRGYTVHSLPPNTQGIAALQILGLLDGFDVSAWGDGTADYYHHMAEATKVAFGDRDAWVSDPEAVDLPAEQLLSTDYLDDRRSLIDPSQSLPANVEPGITPEGFEPQPQDPGGDTCYLSVVDSDGLAVSLIQSIYFDFGSGRSPATPGLSHRTGGRSSRSIRHTSTASNRANGRSTR